MQARPWITSPEDGPQQSKRRLTSRRQETDTRAIPERNRTVLTWASCHTATIRWSNAARNAVSIIAIPNHRYCNLRTAFELWYFIRMRKSYIGILNHSGLDVLLPETQYVDQFLLRRALRENALCFWAVIDDSLFDAIRNELAAGEKRNAARLLQLLASDCGSILPMHSVDVSNGV